MNLRLPALCAALAAVGPALAQSPAPLPTVTLDTPSNDRGVAQRTAHAKALQGRILWMDAGANVGNLNSADKIRDIVAKTKASGFNMIVLDVKPIVGDTIYPSRFAPKLTAWKGQTVAADFDVLRAMLDAAHAQGLPVYANFSTFGEGHKMVKRGLAYDHPDWQTILYEVDRTVHGDHGSLPIRAINAMPKDDQSLTAFTADSPIRANRPGAFAAVVNFNARVIATAEGEHFTDSRLAAPPLGTVLVGTGPAAQWLRENARLNAILTYEGTPKYVKVVDAPEQVYTMFCDPNHPEVRQHEWDIVREVATQYDIDGVVFDDRLRYAGLNADFGPRARAAFEQAVGKPLTWPGDVFTIAPYPGQPVVKGPYYQPWLEWRAGVIHSWLQQAAEIVHSVRPKAQMAVYVGSWYGDYYKFGSNWGASDLEAPFRWLTPGYKQSGYADLLDWLTTGCYYSVATIDEANRTGQSPGATVEAAGQLSNLVVNDAAWTYAGLYALSYQGNPDQFARAIQAAAASSQGVMVFDLSQIVQYDWWPICAQAFAAPAQPPNTVPGLLDQVRAEHTRQKANGARPPYFPPYSGSEGTGF